MKKKIISSLLLAASLLLLTAACQENERLEETTAPEATIEAEESPVEKTEEAPSLSPPPSMDEKIPLTPAPLEEEEAEGDYLFPNIEDYPRVDGSTACIPLMSLIMQKTTGCSVEEAESRIQSSKTFAAYEALAQGETDLLLVYESNDMPQEGVLRSPIGLDALVFIVNIDNPVSRLSHQQVLDIYTGKTENWAKLGGNDLAIRAFQRNETSGSQVLFRKLVMEGTEPIEPITDLVEPDMDENYYAIVDYDGEADGIAYTVYYFAAHMKNDENVKMLKIDGVEANDQTIASGAYPYVNPFYLIVKEGLDDNSPTMKLYHWILSGEGTACLKEAGYVPYSAS